MSADDTKTEGRDENKTSELSTPKGKKKKDIKDEIQIEVTAKLGGIHVTVTSVEGDLTHVIIGGEGFFTQQPLFGNAQMRCYKLPIIFSQFL